MILPLAFALAAGPAAQGTPTAPKWVVNYEDANCSISRDLGLAAGGSYFGVYPTTQFFAAQIIVVLPDVPGSGIRRATATFDGGGPIRNTDIARQPIDGVSRRAVKLGLTADDVATYLARSSRLTIVPEDGPPIVIAFGPMAAPLAALRACQADLMRGWGADPNALLGADDMAQAIRHVGQVGYPQGALRKRVEGRTIAVGAVDRRGKPISCRITVASGDAALDQRTCQTVMRLRFSKAPAAGPETRWLVLPMRWAIIRL